MKLGEWKDTQQFEKAQNISWKEWEKKEGKFLILALFMPSKYPSWTVSFLDEEANLRVRKSLDNETGMGLAKTLKEAEGKAYLKIKKNRSKDVFEIYLEIEKNQEYRYNKEGKALILRKQKEDIPF